jgi:hypothetical protein
LRVSHFTVDDDTEQVTIARHQAQLHLQNLRRTCAVSFYERPSGGRRP